MIVCYVNTAERGRKSTSGWQERARHVERAGHEFCVSGGKVDMDEVGDDVGEAEQWENVAWDGQSDEELDEDSDEEESDEESHEESEQFVRDAIARLQAGETSLW